MQAGETSSKRRLPCSYSLWKLLANWGMLLSGDGGGESTDASPAHRKAIRQGCPSATCQVIIHSSPSARLLEPTGLNLRVDPAASSLTMKLRTSFHLHPCRGKLHGVFCLLEITLYVLNVDFYWKGLCGDSFRRVPHHRRLGPWGEVMSVRLFSAHRFHTCLIHHLLPIPWDVGQLEYRHMRKPGF